MWNYIVILSYLWMYRCVICGNEDDVLSAFQQKEVTFPFIHRPYLVNNERAIVYTLQQCLFSQ